MLIDKWRLWTYKATADEETALTSQKPSGLAAPRQEKGSSGVITVRDYDAIMIKAFGTDAEDETATAMIYGWMDNGPCSKLIEVEFVLGASQFGASEQVIAHGDVPAADYFEADTYTLGSNLVGATAATASGTLVTNHLVIPTLSYKHMQALITAVGGGAEMSTCCVIWRPIRLVSASEII